MCKYCDAEEKLICSMCDSIRQNYNNLLKLSKSKKPRNGVFNGLTVLTNYYERQRANQYTVPNSFLEQRKTPQ